MRSKKPSAAKPPDETTFFIDRSLGIDPIRTELAKAGLVVEIHDDHFARDEEDRRLASNRRRAGLGCAHQGSEAAIPSVGDCRAESQQSRIEIAAVFLTALPRIFRVLHSVPGPFVARVSQSGHVKLT